MATVGMAFLAGVATTVAYDHLTNTGRYGRRRNSPDAGPAATSAAGGGAPAAGPAELVSDEGGMGRAAAVELFTLAQRVDNMEKKMEVGLQGLGHRLDGLNQRVESLQRDLGQALLLLQGLGK